MKIGDIVKVDKIKFYNRYSNFSLRYLYDIWKDNNLNDYFKIIRIIKFTQGGTVLLEHTSNKISYPKEIYVFAECIYKVDDLNSSFCDLSLYV